MSSLAENAVSSTEKRVSDANASGSSALSAATSRDPSESEATKTLKRRTRAARLPECAARADSVTARMDVGARRRAAIAQCVCHTSERSVSRRCVANESFELETRVHGVPPAPNAAGLGSVSSTNASSENLGFEDSADSAAGLTSPAFRARSAAYAGALGCVSSVRRRRASASASASTIPDVSESTSAKSSPNADAPEGPEGESSEDAADSASHRASANASRARAPRGAKPGSASNVARAISRRTREPRGDARHAARATAHAAARAASETSAEPVPRKKRKK